MENIFHLAKTLGKQGGFVLVQITFVYVMSTLRHTHINFMVRVLKIEGFHAKGPSQSVSKMYQCQKLSVNVAKKMTSGNFIMHNLLMSY